MSKVNAKAAVMFLKLGKWTPNLMIAIVGMSMVMGPAKPVIEEMSRNNGNNRWYKQYYVKLMPNLFGKQKRNTA